jgi:two-component system phosphate regulon response regulator PhoB
MPTRILVVEDETDLSDTLVYSLEREGFEARAVRNGREAIAQAAQTPKPDLILLDLMLPDLSGLDVCRTLRADPTTKDIPIIMATARSEEIDRVVGFEVGADDYVVKPLSVRELTLRIKAVLRRRETTPQTSDASSFGRLAIDRAGKRVLVDGEERPVTALEFRLLETLLDRRGRVQTRETLLADVWGVSPDITTRTVDTHVKRLREKLGAAGAYVETVRGFGYRFKTSPDEG